MFSVFAMTEPLNSIPIKERVSAFFDTYTQFGSVTPNFFHMHIAEAAGFAFGIVLIPMFFLNLPGLIMRFRSDKLFRLKYKRYKS